MDEQTLLQWLDGRLPAAGDDAAVIDGIAVTTDALHESVHLPAGTTPYTAGWRAIAASLSDLAAVGAAPVATVATYGAPDLEKTPLAAFVDGAVTVCDRADTAYVGGDLTEASELVISSTAVGRVDNPVDRSGATPGDAVCVTGSLGRTAAALKMFDDELDRANELFRFQPRTAAGRELATTATAMIDSSDGLARSVHQLAAAGDCGFTLESPLPVHDAVPTTSRQEFGRFVGGDFELICTLPSGAVAEMRSRLTVDLVRIGTVTDDGVTIDGAPLPDRGYTHNS
jgi:thiamine-phosphate kinase